VAEGAARALDGWRLVRQMLDDLTDSVTTEAAAADPGVDNWLDTGGRHRGFVILRWLESLEAPVVATRVVPVSDVTR